MGRPHRRCCVGDRGRQPGPNSCTPSIYVLIRCRNSQQPRRYPPRLANPTVPPSLRSSPPSVQTQTTPTPPPHWLAPSPHPRKRWVNSSPSPASNRRSNSASPGKTCSAAGGGGGGGSQTFHMSASGLSDSSPSYPHPTSTGKVQIYCAGCRKLSFLHDSYACTECICGLCRDCVDALSAEQGRGRFGARCPRCAAVGGRFKPFQLDVR